MTDVADPWQPLSGLRVLEVSRTSIGAYAGKLFREYGADVVLVEDPDVESPVRSYGPFAAADVGLNRGGLHRYLNAGKRGVCIRDGHPDGRALVASLAARADLVIHEFVRDEAEQRGITYEQLGRHRESVVVTGITPFGEDGPRCHWRATEEILFAMSGRMLLQGEPARQPVNYAPMVVASQIATTAAGVAIAAINATDDSGVGCGIDVSGVETQLASVDNLFLMWTFAKWQPPRALYGTYTYPCRDGAVLFGALRGKYLEGIGITIGLPDLAFDPRFSTPVALAEHIAEFEEIVIPRFMEFGMMEFVSKLQANGVLCSPLLSAEEALACQQYRGRDFFQPLDAELACDVPGPMFRLEASTPPPTPCPAPRLGEHSAEILRSWLEYDLVQVRELVELGTVAQDG